MHFHQSILLITKLLVFLIHSLSESVVVISTTENDNSSSTKNSSRNEFYFPSSLLEGTYETICSRPGNENRNLPSGEYINTFVTCTQNHEYIQANCAKEFYFLEFIEQCVHIPCGVRFDAKLTSAVHSGRAKAKPCQLCSDSCHGDVYYGDRCDPIEESSLLADNDRIAKFDNPLYECPTNVPYTVNIPHPCGCRKFQRCHKGRKSVAYCEKGAIYDTVNNMCVPESEETNCRNSMNCDEDLIFENQYDVTKENIDWHDLFDLIRSLSDDNADDNNKNKGFFDATNIYISNVYYNFDINEDNDEAELDHRTSLATTRLRRNDCADSNLPRNFQFQVNYYDVYATCVNDREIQIVFCPDGSYFNRHVAFCIPIPDESKFKIVHSGHIDSFSANRCRYCTPQSQRL